MGHHGLSVDPQIDWEVNRMTAMSDGTMLICRDCGVELWHSPEEASLFRERGFVDERGRVVPPSQCLPCRRARRQQRKQDGYYDQRASSVRW
jgi:hypothetical protein